MKNILTVVIIISVTKFCFGQNQTDKGVRLIGGTFNVSTNPFMTSLSPTQSKVRGIYLDPTIGRFVKNNFALGINLPLSSHYSRQPNGYYKMKYFGLNPFIRIYFPNTKSIKFFGQVGAGYGKEYYKSSSWGNSTQYYSNLSLRPGMNYFVTSNIAFEATINYTYSFATRYTADQGNDYLAINIGLQIFLNKKVVTPKKQEDETHE